MAKDSREETPVEEENFEEETLEDQKYTQTKKKRRISGGRLALIIVLVVVVLLILLFFFIFRGRARNMTDLTNAATSAVATIGDISVTIEGTGTLQSGTVTDVDVPAGITIDQVKVENGDIVKTGDVLATVKEGSVASALLEVRDELDTVEDQLDNLSGDTDDPDTTAYLEAKVLNAEFSDLKQAEYDLEDLLDTLQIKATCDGTVTGVAVSDDTEVTAGGAGSASSGSSDSADSYANILSSMSYTEEETAAKADSQAGTASAGGSSTLLFLSATEPVEEETDAGETQTESGEIQTFSDDIQYLDDPESEPIHITNEFVIPVTTPKTGEKPQTKVEEIKDTDGNVLIKTSSITWDCSTETFQGGTAYTATIILEAADDYVFDCNVIPVVEGSAVRYYRLYDDDKILYVQATFAATEESKTSDTGETGDKGTTGNTGNTGDTGTTGNTGNIGSTGDTSGTGGTTSGITSGTGGTTSGITGDTGTGTTGTDTDGNTQLAEYNVYEAAAFSVASGTDMTVSINVDELDILSVKEGQSAVVTLDALEDESFNGRITKISTTASSTGGSAKYAVEITLNKTDDMMVGMSASATIYTEEAKNALLIPVSALQESGRTTFVYTQSDDEGNLSGEVEVETGLSDGLQVQILSGLSEGETVYYLRSESTESSLLDMFGGGMGGAMGGAMGGGGTPDAMDGERGGMGGGMGPLGN